MDEIWVGIAAVIIALIALVGAGWAVLRAHDVTGLFDNLAHVLRAKGILLAAATDSGPSSGSRENATPTGPQPVVRQTPPTDAEEVNPLEAPPPALPDGTLVWDYLTHYTHNPETSLQGVTAEFYGRGVNDLLMGPYFHGIDRDALERKFHHTLVIVLKQGVRRSAVVSMAKVHGGVRTPDGTPITGQVWNRTIELLGEVLADAGIPLAAIKAIAKTVEPLRRAIVAEA